MKSIIDKKWMEQHGIHVGINQAHYILECDINRNSEKDIIRDLIWLVYFWGILND